MTYPGQSFGDPGSASRTATVVLDANVSNYSQQMGAAAQQTNALSQSVGTLQSKLHGFDKWAGRMLFRVSAADFAVLGAATADAATFEKQLSTLAATSAITGTSLRSVKVGIEAATQKFPTSRADVIALTESLTNLGVTGAAQLSSLTQTFIKLGAATGESSVGLAQGLTQLSRLMGVTDAGQIGNMANSLLTVSKNAGVSATGVLNFAQSIAPMARQAGIGEAAVLGIATAFSKANADGFVAANTFNQMVGDITQLTSSGSPDLAKYANLIGVTVDKFKSMDKTTALTDIFDTLSKQGPDAINTLNQLGIAGGVRAQSAIAAVTQSGDLKDQVALALGSQSNQKNLDKGAGAAFNNLADSLARLRNAFTEIGTVIGTTFLTPLTAATNVMGTFARGLAGVIHPLSSVIALGAGLGGVLAGAGGIAMNAAGIIGMVALFNMVRKGTHIASMAGGYASGRDPANLNQRDAESLRRYNLGPRVSRSMYPGGPAAADEYNRERMSGLQRAGFAFGRGVSGITGPAPGPNDPPLPPLRQLSTWRNLGLSVIPRALNALNRGTGTLLRESVKSDWDRVRFRDEQPRIRMGERFNTWVREVQGLKPLDVLGKEARRSAAVMGDTGSAYTSTGAVQAGHAAMRAIRYGAPMMVTSLVGGFFGVPHVGTMVANALRRSTGDTTPSQAAANLGKAYSQGAYAFGAALRHPISSMGQLAKASGMAGIAIKDLAVSTAKAAAGMVVGGAWKATTSVVSGVWSMGRSLLSGLMSGPGLIGVSASMYGYQKWRDKQKEAELDQYLNPIQKYNDVLGIVTTNLANFGQSLTAATTQIGGTAQTMAEAMQVSTQTVATAPNKPLASVWGALGSGASTEQAAAVLGTMQITDPKQLLSAQQDMAAVGMDKAKIQAVMDLYGKQGGPSPSSGLARRGANYALLGQSVVNTEGKGINWDPSFFHPFGHGSASADQSVSGAKIMATALTGIKAQSVTDATTYNGAYAQQHALINYAKLFDPMMRSAATGSDQGNATADAMARAASKITGGGYGGYLSTILDRGHGYMPNSKMSATDSPEMFIKLLQSTHQGRNYLNKLTTSGGTLDPGQWKNALVNLSNTSDGSDFNSLLRIHGGSIGRFAADNKVIQSAIGARQDDPGRVRQSVDIMVDRTMKISDGFEGAQAALGRFQSAIGDTNSVLYKQATAAQQIIAQNEENAKPFESRATVFHQAIRGYSAAKEVVANAIAGGQKPTTDQIASMDQKKQAYESELAAQQQYQTAMYQTALQFGVQMNRAQEDMYGPEGQMSRAQDDYFRSRRNAQDDYQRQTERSTEDFARQMSRQAESSAQGIYDPFKRVQSEYTTDAGTLSQNLADQNRRIAQQQSQLEQAKKAGLSQQAIDTLQLNDPNNAQQLNEIVQGLVNNPGLIKKINEQVGTRVSSTAKLTQSSFNLSYRNTVQDFTIAMNRAAQDYDTAKQRADKQQEISLGRMAYDYGKQVRRAGEDLTQAMTEVTGSFGHMYNKTMGQIAASVQKFSPAAAAQMSKDLKALVTEFPFLMKADSDWNGGDPAKPGVPTQRDRVLGNPIPHALGGVSTFAHQAYISEGNKSEAIIPLDNRGLSFMTEFMSGVTRELLQRMFTGGLPGVPRGTASGSVAHISEDHSTNFSGPVSVTASDPAEMARKLAAQARLKKLTSPAGAG